jgi:parallel beta-helix repeat protein
MANGTGDMMIRFTSNRDNPAVGDWNTLDFTGTLQSSMFYCVIAFGTNGITMENGVLNIQNSVIGNNSRNGIEVVGGSATINNDEIAGNVEAGIYIAGGNTITVQNNTIRGNADGMVLAGHLTFPINVNQNSIFDNTRGISLEADAFDNTLILNNRLSTNGYGFYVSTTANTNITHNYIYDNNIGISYDRGTAHIAHFNDIYENNLGMDVSGSAMVNATSNYWGDESGPYHALLNPRGRGNRVGGDGVNLDFIFFLTNPIDYTNTPPTAVLWTDKILVAPNQNVTFVGADSYDDGRVDQYFFDFGDSRNSGWTTLTLFDHSYSSTGSYTAGLRVIDDFGVTSNTVYAAVNVQNLFPLDVAINLSQFAINFGQQMSVTVKVTVFGLDVANANVTMFAVKDGTFSPQTGLTDANGYFTTTFTAPNITDITDVRIIARASAAGYADGSDYEYLKVLPPLIIQTTLQPATVKSEEAATLTTRVTLGSWGEAVPDALLALSYDLGTFSTSSGVTDLNGTAVFNYTAPQTTTIVNATVLITTTKMGYAGGQEQLTITILPKVLNVQVTATSNVVTSEAELNVTAHVTYDTTPIPQANVTIASDNGGNFSTPTAMTDVYGDTIFTFTAPPANTPLSINFTARASKVGYADGEGTMNVTVYSGTLEVEVESALAVVKSQETALITVIVTSNATPVANASVTVSTNYGDFLLTSGTSDANGYCTFTFNAPRTAIQLSAVIGANATKNGFTDAENQTVVTITPEVVSQEEGGWPLTTMLLIIIPIVVVVIVVILIKLKVIAVSSNEEE